MQAIIISPLYDFVLWKIKEGILRNDDVCWMIFPFNDSKCNALEITDLFD